MAKKFVIVCLWLMIATAGQSAPVDPNAPDGVVSRFYYGGDTMALDSQGQTWWLGPGHSSWDLVGNRLPVPLGEVAAWYGYYLETASGEIYFGELHNVGEPTEWLLCPDVPTGPVGTENSSLNDLKARFR